MPAENKSTLVSNNPPFKGWTRESGKQGGANSAGEHTGVYTKTDENGKEVRALFKTDQNKSVLLAEFTASQLAYNSDPEKNPKIELALADNEVYLVSYFHQTTEKGKPQDLFRHLGYEDRPKAIAEQSTFVKFFEQNTSYGTFVEKLIRTADGKQTFAKLMVPALKLGDRDRHIGNIMIRDGDPTQLLNIDFGAAFGQGAGYDKIVHPHKKLLSNMLKRKATNHFLDFPLELRTSQEMVEEILKQTTETAVESDIKKFEKSLDAASLNFSIEELKDFGKYLFKDLNFEEYDTKDPILNAINERFAETLQTRCKNLREFACEIAIGRAIERAPVVNGKKDFSQLREDVTFIDIVKANLTYFDKLARGETKIGKDVKDRTKVIKNLNLNKGQISELVAGLGQAVTTVKTLQSQQPSFEKPAELSENSSVQPSQSGFGQINNFFAPPSQQIIKPDPVDLENIFVDPSTQPVTEDQSLDDVIKSMDAEAEKLTDMISNLDTQPQTAQEVEGVNPNLKPVSTVSSISDITAASDSPNVSFASASNPASSSSETDIKTITDFRNKLSKQGITIPENARSIIFTKPKMFGIFESRKEIGLTAENLTTLKNYMRIGDKQDGEKERIGWNIAGYLDENAKEIEIKPEAGLQKETSNKSSSSNPSMFEKFKNASKVTKALIIGGAILVGAALAVGAVISGGVALPAYAGALAAGGAALGLTGLGAGAWKTQKDFLGKSTSNLRNLQEQAKNETHVAAAQQPTQVSQSSSKTAISDERLKDPEPTKTWVRKVTYTPSPLDAKLGHKELNSVTIDELKADQKNLDERLKTKFGPNFKPNWEEVVNKDGHPKPLDPKSVAERQETAQAEKSEITK